MGSEALAEEAPRKPEPRSLLLGFVMGIAAAMALFCAFKVGFWGLAMGQRAARSAVNSSCHNGKRTMFENETEHASLRES